jgi:hypothetical protein
MRKREREDKQRSAALYLLCVGVVVRTGLAKKRSRAKKMNTITTTPMTVSGSA